MTTARTARTARQPSRTDPPALQARAMDNLQFIRDTMEQAAAFTAVSGLGMVGVGIIAIAAAPLAHGVQRDAARWVAVWLAVAASALALSAVTTVRKARRANASLLSGPGRKLVLAFAPPMAVGALLTAVLFARGLTELLPGVWLLLYGTAVVTGGAFSVRIVPALGFVLIGLGAGALFAPAAAGDWFMAAGFGVAHVVFGALIARRHGG